MLSVIWAEYMLRYGRERIPDPFVGEEELPLLDVAHR